ncbi:inter-alpha-trypsin inhibitor heavy chain H3-like isoform X2 [Cheilinus undulatus]|uniref:inter-alpha-trypsin inhibitor heavy chain H3-like isoform X2 n=1 Tax=Cheilinus undulatus TaxID=241271 RepID=UPI001BD5EA58|nr:inter-alpha-trypsin inhibitor heavy chain H3-like isoform X2 [Cheilinus undulatus]
MVQAVVQLVLFGLLSALVATHANKDDWDIYSFHINSTVSSRYATTVITSRVANRMNESKEVEFQVRIPKNAFISKFRMFIDGQPYDGVVKAKEAAKQQYTDAVSRGQSAGIVSSVGRTLEEFKTSVNVAAHKKVTFELTYEELLKRKLGKYELQIHARPMQPVKDFKVDVHINEDAGINFLEVKGGLSTNAMANAITKTLADKQAWLYFYPTEDQQKSCDSCGEQGMNGDLVIVYDVNRDASFGDIKKSSGYFVHHFAPSNLARIPKNVIFVIDQSGSMRGRKIQQTRIALIHILNDLAEDDFFGLITFDGSIFHWKRELVQANEQNVASAKTFAQNIQSSGATDINQAVLEGTSMLNRNPREGSASILILLTDGDPTSGVTNLEVIQSNVREAINGKFPLYCLGFGFDVNFEFLEKMSLQNNGVARRIYEESDADLQLKGFYEEVATPLLTDVTMIYEGGVNVTQTNFSQYYNGSEIVVAGQITDNNIETFTPQVIAISRRTRVVFTETNTTVESTGTVSDSNIQRVWAYLTVKQLLEKELQLSGPEKENAKKEALELSLKYSFVTPLTSMVVTKPPGGNADVLHKPKEGETPQDPRTHSQYTIAGGLSVASGALGGSGGVHSRFLGHTQQGTHTYLQYPIALPAGADSSSAFLGGGFGGGLSFPGHTPQGTHTYSQYPVGQGLPTGGLAASVGGLGGGNTRSFGQTHQATHPYSQYPVAQGVLMAEAGAAGGGFGGGNTRSFGHTPQGTHTYSQYPVGQGLPTGGAAASGGGFGGGNTRSFGHTPQGTHTYSQYPITGGLPAGAGSSSTFLGRGFGGGVSFPGIIRPDSPVLNAPARPATPPPLVPNPALHVTQFLHKTENQALPLCYNVIGNINLKLLHNPNAGLLVNGELDALLGGFRRIAIYTTNAKFELDGLRIVVRDPQGTAIHLQENEIITRDGVTVIRRPKEIDFVCRDTRIVLLIHEKSGLRFLWPVIRQQLTDGNLTGILALNPAAYEVMQQNPLYANLKIQNNEMLAARSTATDYSIPSAPMLDCWLVTSEFALQRSIYGFLVPHI